LRHFRHARNAWLPNAPQIRHFRVASAGWANSIQMLIMTLIARKPEDR
jgi:hypothetical protein